MNIDFRIQWVEINLEIFDIVIWSPPLKLTSKFIILIFVIHSKEYLANPWEVISPWLLYATYPKLYGKYFVKDRLTLSEPFSERINPNYTVWKSHHANLGLQPFIYSLSSSCSLHSQIYAWVQGLLNATRQTPLLLCLFYMLFLGKFASALSFNYKYCRIQAVYTGV